MSRKRHEKVLRRKARMGRRGKQLREARRQQRIADRRVDLEIVCSSLMAGVEEGGTEEKVRDMKDKLNRLYGKAGEAG